MKDCRTEINDTFLDYAEFINISTPTYSLSEYSDNYSDISGSLWGFKWDKKLTSILKSTKFSGHLLLRESADKQISKSASQLKSGFWDVAEAAVDAESRLEFQKVIGYHQTSRGGFGSFKSPSIPPKNSHEYRRLVSDLVGEVDENAYHAKSMQLHLQGYWTK